MTDKHKQVQDSAPAQRVERRVQASEGAAGLAERRRFGPGFAPLDKSHMSTDEVMKTYLDLLQERRNSNPKN